jgi:2,5-dihydroxypyridine 5,6-dioxygenase
MSTGQAVNPAKLNSLFRRQFQLCNVKRGETIAIISDPGTRREYVMAAFAAADDLGADSYELGVNSVPGGCAEAFQARLANDRSA